MSSRTETGSAIVWRTAVRACEGDATALAIVRANARCWDLHALEQRILRERPDLAFPFETVFRHETGVDPTYIRPLPRFGDMNPRAILVAAGRWSAQFANGTDPDHDNSVAIGCAMLIARNHGITLDRESAAQLILAALGGRRAA